MGKHTDPPDKDAQSNSTTSFTGNFFHKAGLQNINKLAISSIIDSMTLGSKFQQRINTRSKRISDQATELRSRIKDKDYNSPLLKNLVDESVKKATCKTLKLIESGSLYLHLDMDAFYASIEELLNPGLANVPMAVGSLSMLATANYTARKFGIASAMPGYIAKRLCPELVIVPGHFKLYKAFSIRIKSILLKYDPKLLSYSFDEASLCLSHLLKDSALEDQHRLVTQIRDEIFLETGLTCSGGLAYSRCLSKIASNAKKPNGQFILPTLEYIKEWLSPQSIRKISGIGPVTEQLLKETLGIYTCNDIFRHRYKLAVIYQDDPDRWQSLLFASLGLSNSSDSENRSSEDIESKDEVQKSISVDRSFPPIDDISILEKTSLSILDKLIQDTFRRIPSDTCAHTLTLKVKSDSFEIFSKSKTFKEPILLNDQSLAHPLLESSTLQMLEPFFGLFSIRLLGLRLSNFSKQVPLSNRIDIALKSTTSHNENPSMHRGCSYCHKNLFFSDLDFSFHEQECQISVKKDLSPQKDKSNNLLCYFNRL